MLKRYIKIRTEVPGPRSKELLTKKEQFVANGAYCNYPIFVDHAAGAVVTDVDGNRFIDFGAGIGVLNVGHAHPKIVRAIADQASRLTHACFHVTPYPPYIELARRLAELTPGSSTKKVYFANSGAEANENAAKIARYFTGRQALVAFGGGFHGRTFLGLSLTAKEKPFKSGFGPFAPFVHHVPYPWGLRCAFRGGLGHRCNKDCYGRIIEILVEQVQPEKVAAVFIEPVQGEGGFIVPPPGFLSFLAGFCRKNGILLIADEIQTGFARTGRLFASEHWGLAPDLMTLAKSMAGGLPLGAVVGREEIMDAVHSGGLGGTFGGNPVACNAALEVLRVIESESLVKRAEKIGEVVRGRLGTLTERHSQIAEVRGLGAMIAMEFVKDREGLTPAPRLVKSILKTALSRGLIALKAGSHGHVIRLMMPLSIPFDQLDEGLSVLEASIEDSISAAAGTS